MKGLRENMGRRILERLTRHLGRPSGKVPLPPTPIIPGGVENAWGARRVYSSRIVSGAPERDLGFLAFHLPASDIASFGADPKLVSYSIIFPLDIDESRVLAIGESLGEEAYRYGASVISSSVTSSESVSEPLVTVTMIGETKKLITPQEASPTDLLLLVGVPGAELLYRLAHEKPDLFSETLGDRALKRWRASRWMLSAVDAARHLSMYDWVRGMMHSDENGLRNLLIRFSEASELGFRVHLEKILYPPELSKLSRRIDLDPLGIPSSGVLLVALSRTAPVGWIVDSLHIHGFPVRAVGELVSPEKGRKLILAGGEEIDLIAD